jgi:hypothetical protein
VPGNLRMPKEATIQVSEAKGTPPETSTQFGVPDENPPEEGEVADDPRSEEVADGYGHGV